MEKAPSFEIVYLSENVDKRIIQEYWEVSDSGIEWSNSVEKVAECYDKKVREISDFIKKYSRFNVSCSKCGKLIGEYKLRSHFNFQDYLSQTKILCGDCHDGSNYVPLKSLTISEPPKTLSKAEKMIFAFETQQWRDLNELELEVLIKVAESTSLKEIHEKVFPIQSYNADIRKTYWNILNRLESLNLIWMERGQNNKIIQYHTHGALYKTLLESYPDLVVKRTEPIAPIAIDFTLGQNSVKTGKGPDFTGKKTLKHSIELQPDSTLECAVWFGENADELYVRISENSYFRKSES
ncbi:MAG: hypothetical protein RIC80_23320 [Cyclobacteriaceae bacterium]